MKRRDFVKMAVPVSTVPFLVGGFSLRAYGHTPILDAFIGASKETDHVLVLIQLNGGNDGLNMVIPLDQYPSLMNARANIAIDESKVLQLTTATGIHPAMPELQQVFADNQLAVIQSVGYPNPNFSHFRATDIWLTASGSDTVLTSGWLGRYLDDEYPDYPNGYPNAVDPDPLAIQIGSVVSNGLQGPSVSMGMALTSPTSFYQLVSGGIDTAPDTPAGHELTFLREVAQQTQAYSTTIKNAASKATNLSTLYPTAGQNPLADQLKIVAQLVAGGLKTRIYVVNLGGFDNHSAQVSATGGTDTGTHAKLLGELSLAIAAFLDDLHLLGAEKRVIGMTFSEFGRRIKSNASLGTDHGTAAPLFVFGKRIYGRILGTNPVLPANAGVNDNIAMQYDFRSVYASILKEWFGASDHELTSVLLQGFQTLPLVQPDAPSRYPITNDQPSADTPWTVSLSQNYPNPFNPSTHIRFTTSGNYVRVKVYDAVGREVRSLVDGTYPAGEHDVIFDGTGLPSGTYYCRIESGSFHQVRTMILMK